MSSLFNIAAGNPATASFYDYEIENSLRLNRNDSANLERTPSSEGDRQTHTTSMWVKRVELGRSTRLFMATNNSSNATYQIIGFNSSDQLSVLAATEGSSAVVNVKSNAVFRDVSAWYHIVVAQDTTQSTSSNRFKLYVNGTQITDLGSTTYGSQNASYRINDNIVHYLNKDGSSLGNNYSSYYVAEVNFIDGQQLNPTSFGETKSGVWIPKEYTGSYGTNGFHLEFGDSSNIGDDTSGNTNDFTTSNLAAVDVTLDSPTNNFATLNPLIKGTTYGVQSDPAPTNGNLEIAMPGGTNNIAVSTFELQAPNKYRCSFELTSRGSSTNFELGICNVTDSINNGDVLYNSSGFIANESGTQQSSLTDANTVGDIVEILVDLDANNVKFALKENGSSTWAALGTAENITANLTNPIVWVREQGSSNINGKMDFGQLGYVGSDDENYLPMSTANLPEPSITPLDDDLPEDYFNTVTYAGNSADRNIEVGFKSDFIWVKSRDTTDNHRLYNVIAGEHACLFSSTTGAESTATDGIAFDFATGFNIDDGVNRQSYNKTGEDYVSWNWKAGTSFSNSAGANGADIASTGSVNTKAGFSIVSYTGSNSADDVVYHGIGTAPSLIIIKNRDVGTSSGAWGVFTDRVEAERLQFDTNDDFNNYPIQSFSANTFQLPTLNNTAWSAANGYIAYCFASIEGYSKIGIYSGNGSSNGAYIYTGFRPAYVLIKQTSATGNNWNVHDNKRGSSNEADPTITNNNVVDKRLLASTSGAETTFTSLDFVSNGFKLRNSGSSYNGSGSTYLYMAFAEMPFKYANAR
jgi:hypothetical protein